jgi:hypothetical protein
MFRQAEEMMVWCKVRVESKEMDGGLLWRDCDGWNGFDEATVEARQLDDATPLWDGDRSRD